MKQRTDITNTALVDDSGTIHGICRKCPHCGMTDLQHSAQGMYRSHHLMTRVGALLKYECGKCRKQFHVLELCVPAGENPLNYYEQHIAPTVKGDI